MTIRLVKILPALSVGSWGLTGAIGNLSGLSGVYETIAQVTTMSGVPEGVRPPWRTENPMVVWASVTAIVFGKLAALLSGVGGVVMLRQINSGSHDFQSSKILAVAGYGMAFALMYFSFKVVAESGIFMFY